MKSGNRRVKKEDSARVLLTETCPYEVPIIFSNTGFYWHVKKYESGTSLFPRVMDYLFHGSLTEEYTLPLTYKVRKDEDSFRVVSLLHPRVQIGFVEFYKEFSDQILLACSKSQFSIRRPSKIAGKYFAKNQSENIRKYRAESLSLASSEVKYKHLTSYFSYSDYTRLYRFFDSSDFLSLERQYSSFWSLDISKFFDSIYTHSIDWALKTKPFSKTNTGTKNTFGAVFDRLMQVSNYNETAGIIIGPEICRIFSEVIFQQIDLNVETELGRVGFECGRDYVIRRYVDDIFIFATNDSVASVVAKCVEVHAKEYKLNLNKSKTTKASRPFVTSKTKSLRLIKNALSNFELKLVSKGEDGEGEFEPRRVFNRKKLCIAFLNEVKSACIDDAAAYGLVCGYLMSALKNLLVRVAEKNITRTFEDKAGLKKYSDFFHVILEVIFHLYTVSPGHKGSVNLFVSSTVACSFFSRHLPDEIDSIKSKIYTSCRSFFESSEYAKMAAENGDYALLEALNLLVLLKEIGEDYLVPRQLLESLVKISERRRFSYFEIVVLLYYIGNNASYASIKRSIIKDINSILESVSDLRLSSEKLYLFLDSMTCPYLDEAFKSKLAAKLLKQIYSAEATPQEISELTLKLGKYPWFVSWANVDFVTALEKKELLRGY
ncbi:hypothetical protein CH92_17930 [Stutzerimonas stutzeri]|uniref:Reverse transcriptase domain-containing protein n=1 Tax=Stutzerimonas stutzeri TaxID=316 RepID=W8RD53_STUST|nr:antiviral reverse transcriptase Drt3b [Stutzerimonas stutzeri]AHL77683.1 hypothetical protein CH92_17930 [Stutzerimonas stutzeri]MCQ4331045.1 RNA-directed DNA polymerase [Stutzerimonas stutzeri]